MATQRNVPWQICQHVGIKVCSKMTCHAVIFIMFLGKNVSLSSLSAKLLTNLPFLIIILTINYCLCIWFP